MNRMLCLCTVPLLAAGCIRKETSHTVYLDPHGGATWMVLEKDIRSDESDPKDRTAEENEYMQSFRAGQHDSVLALDRLGADWVDWRVLRDERPYMVAIEAHFAALDLALQSFFDEMSAPVPSPIYAEIQWEEDCARLVISCDFGRIHEIESIEQTDSDRDHTEVFLSLIDGVFHQVVLTEGRFTDAVGFEINEDEDESEDVAKLIKRTREEVEAAAETDEYGHLIVYSLTWTISNEP